MKFVIKKTLVKNELAKENLYNFCNFFEYKKLVKSKLVKDDFLRVNSLPWLDLGRLIEFIPKWYFSILLFVFK